MDEIQRPWDAMPPRGVASLFRTWPGRWWIAGGWSLDLFLGHPTRLHEDTDVMILQRDLHHVHAMLPDWIVMAADPPGTLRHWVKGEVLPDEVRDIWCRPQGSDTWWFQLMVVRTDGDHWVFPRDSRITGEIADLSDRREGIPVLAPEIQLLYKSRVPHRPKDAYDLQRMIPRLSTTRQAWLRERVEILYSDSPALNLLP